MLQANHTVSFAGQSSNRFHASAGSTIDYKISANDLVAATFVLTGYQKPLKVINFDEMGAITPLTSRDVQSLKFAGFQPEFSQGPERILQIRML